jgi:hypothetical protein
MSALKPCLSEKRLTRPSEYARLFTLSDARTSNLREDLHHLQVHFLKRTRRYRNALNMMHNSLFKLIPV